MAKKETDEKPVKYIACTGFAIAGKGVQAGTEVDVSNLDKTKIKSLVDMRRMLPEGHPDFEKMAEPAIQNRAKGLKGSTDSGKPEGKGPATKMPG